jgi:hypothetical protein
MMDLLGQKEMYKVLEDFPDSEDGLNTEFKDKLIHFVRMIDYFKKDVDSFLYGANIRESHFECPEEAKAFLTKSKTEISKVQRFSDGIMVYVSLAETDDSFPVSSVFTALICAASIMLISLAKGNPIRVGIGIGGAAEIEEGELFGPAIGYAHEMESKRAKNPRIAIHERVIDYLTAHDGLIRSNDIEYEYVFSISNLCKSMIRKDEDGEYILDYLGNAAWNYSLKSVGRDLINLAYTFIKSQKERFEAEGNEKLVGKYSYLLNYFLQSGRVTNK